MDVGMAVSSEVVGMKAESESKKENAVPFEINLCYFDVPFFSFHVLAISSRTNSQSVS